MKNIFFIILLICFYNLSFAKFIGTNYNLLYEKDGVTYEKKNNHIFSGKMTFNKDRFYFENGRPHGKWLTFYDNGNIRSIETWKNGKLNGKYVLYHENGQKIFETTYINGKDDGDYKLYHSNGFLQVKGQFKNGTPIGKWKYFNDKGILIGSGDYKIIGQ